MSIVCPIDGKDDAIQKVSAVVSGGITKGMAWSYSDSMYISETRVSELARMLKLPDEPQKSIWFYIKAMDRAMYTSRNGLIFLGCLTFPVSLLWIPIWLLSGARHRHETKHQQWEADYSAEFSAEKAAWESMKTRWERLYYCYRHDIVFDPHTRETCSPKDLRQFLHLDT